MRLSTKFSLVLLLIAAIGGVNLCFADEQNTAPTQRWKVNPELVEAYALAQSLNTIVNSKPIATDFCKEVSNLEICNGRRLGPDKYEPENSPSVLMEVINKKCVTYQGDGFSISVGRFHNGDSGRMDGVRLTTGF